MQLREVLRSRHSVRDYRDTPVPAEVMDRLVFAASTAPSSMNEQPWMLYVTTGKTREVIGEVMTQTTTHLREYVDALTPEMFEIAARWYGSLGNAPVVVGVAVNKGQEGLEQLNRYLSVGAAIENLLLAAVDEGLAACNITSSFWVRDELSEILGVPDDWELVSLVAIGYPTDEPPLAPKHDPDIAIYLD
jgi:nitroreductase